MIRDREATQGTCMVRFGEALQIFFGDDPQRRRDATVGFWIGLAEKVGMGACRAAMVRPNLGKNPWATEALSAVANHWGLVVTTFKYGDITELWITRPANAVEVENLLTCAVNSPEWHTRRGLLCGVPVEEIDPEFHLRPGYGEFIDRR